MLSALFETDRIFDLLEQRTAHFLQELQVNVGRRKRVDKGKYKYPGITRDKLFERLNPATSIIPILPISAAIKLVDNIRPRGIVGSIIKVER